MLKKRIIPTLLTDGQNLVKGSCFDSWRTVGSVVAAAKVFAMRDVDELVLLDVSATDQNRVISSRLVKSVADCLQVPFAAGGGVRNLQDFEACLRAGADKVVIGSYALENPDFLCDAADKFGSQAVVACIDIFDNVSGNVAIASGSKVLSLTALEAAEIVANAGAGEILLQNIKIDGLMTGMELDWVRKITETVSIPVVASSGASSYSDMERALNSGASGVAVGALFQFTENTPKGARDFLESKGFPIRK